VVAAIDPSDTVNLGFGDPAAAIIYTFAFTCLGAPTPASLGGTVIFYGLINRYDANNPTLDLSQQLYTSAARGLLASTTPNPNGSLMPISCVGIGGGANETVWPDVGANLCSLTVSAGDTVALCGLYARMPLGPVPAACTTNTTDFANLSAIYPGDTDLTTGQADPYIAYQGNGQRLLTVSVVDTVANTPAGAMTVLGFRQFLLEPNSTGTFDPSDTKGRFVAQYVGSPAPVSQGYIDDRFGLGCPAPVTSGVSKVVLNQ
jgi:hypothetical protein